MEAFEAYKKEKKMKNDRKDSKENLGSNVQVFEDTPVELEIIQSELKEDFRRERDNLYRLRKTHQVNPSDELSEEIRRSNRRLEESYLKYVDFSNKMRMKKNELRNQRRQ